MRCQMGVVSWVAAACLSLTARGLDADEECYKGYHYPTSVEEGAMRPVLAGASSALPAEFQGWVVSGDEALHVNAQCMDNEPRPWGYSLYRTFERVDDREQRERKLEKAGGQYQAALQANQPVMDTLMARIQELATEAMAAAQAGDYDKVDAINVEIEKVSAQYEALMQGGGALANLDATNEEAARDRTIRIEVAINPGFELLGYEARKVSAPAGAAHALRWADTRSGPHDATQLVLFGSWRADENSYGQAPRPGVPQTVTQGLSVRVTADEARIDQVLGTIDFQALAQLVSR